MIKRRKPLNRIGKKTKEWIDARKLLKEIYFDKGITSCEVRLVGCTGENFLSLAHRYKRSDPRCEHTFEQTLLCCITCHQRLEQSEDLTRAAFHDLRKIWYP